MHTVGRIDLAMYEKITSDITTDEVIITEERMEHSNLHDRAFDRYGVYIPDILRAPDLIFEDKNPNTAILIKQVEEDGKNAQLVLRLHVSSDHPEHKNSIISFWIISEGRRKNYERNKRIVYIKKEV